MRRPRSGVGAELVPLVLILAGLAGSLAMIVAVHRKAIPRRPARTVVAVAPSPIAKGRDPHPAPPPPADPEPEPEPPSPPPPDDPTPRALARLTSAEAAELLEASKADRKAAALEEARKAAVAESERWRRRESLVNAQLSGLDAKVRKIEAEVDQLALERDALLRERDARKAAAARSRSRPGQAILPHKGPNGTWRRPIVVECRDGMAILQPGGVGFGLLELASGFGPSSNPFVAAIAREAVRIQRQASPDGAPVVPYIFFLVRPDGVRPYYEARGRLEPLGITFGYELADQDWDVEFPNLDDRSTWDGSSPSQDPLAEAGPRPGGGSPAEDENFPAWGTSRRGASVRGDVDGTTSPDFTWPGQKALALAEQAGGARLEGPSSPGLGEEPRPIGGPGGDPLAGIPGLPGQDRTDTGIEPGGNGNAPGVVGPNPAGLGGDATGGPGRVPGLAPPESGGPGGGFDHRPNSGRDDRGLDASGRSPSPGGMARTPNHPGQADSEPGPDFIWPARPGGARKPDGRPSGASGLDSADPDSPGQPAPGSTSYPSTGSTPPDATLPRSPRQPATDEADDSPPTFHKGPFTRPLGMGLQLSTPSGSAGTSAGSGSSGDASGNQGSGGGQPARRMLGQSKPSGGRDSTGQPTQAAAGLGIGPASGSPTGGMPSSGSPTASPPPAGSLRAGSTPRTPSMPDLESGRIIDRRFEVVVVCGPRGVIVQPGGYRVTADALKDRDGLLKKQMVALIKARRAADPKVIIEPRVRFLVQAGGESTYWAARSQTLLSGLDWPMTTQVADPDPLAILPSEGW